MVEWVSTGQNEAKRFLAALSKRAELRGSEEFMVAELFDLADTLELAVPDVSEFISQLNDAGALLMIQWNAPSPSLYLCAAVLK